jgi:hypothetical protein
MMLSRASFLWSVCTQHQGATAVEVRSNISSRALE